MSENQTPVRPVDPVAPWLGGKSRLAELIISWINSVDHVLYAEPFVGMGGVFLRRNQRPKAEVINDFSRDVSNLFRVVQRHYVPIVDLLRWQLTTRDDWEIFLKTDPTTLTDMQRAVRFLYLLKTSFGGKVVNQAFGVDTTGSGRFDVADIVPALEALHGRLRGVTIESLSFEKFIPRYDRPHTLFYIDPPYYGCEDDYGKELFSREAFTLLAEQLRSLQGKFILSLNDCPEVRKIFDGFGMHQVKTVYTIEKGANAKDVFELLIHNLPAEPQQLQASMF